MGGSNGSPTNEEGQKCISSVQYYIACTGHALVSMCLVEWPHSCTEVHHAEFKMEKVGKTGSNSSPHLSTTAHLLT